jgi:hypothetical protein
MLHITVQTLSIIIAVSFFAGEIYVLAVKSLTTYKKSDTLNENIKVLITEIRKLNEKQTNQ